MPKILSPSRFQALAAARRPKTPAKATASLLAIAAWLAAGGAMAGDQTISALTSSPQSTTVGDGTGPGDILITNTGSVDVTLSNAAAVTIDSANDVTNNGNIINRGINNAVAVLVPTAVSIAGNLENEGTILTTAANNVAVRIEGDMTGRIFNGGSISTGVAALFDADGNRTQNAVAGGTALAIGGNIAGGIFNDGPVGDASTPIAGSIITRGSAPTILIAPSVDSGGADDITIGAVAGSGFGILNRGSITSQGGDQGVSSTAIRIEGVAPFTTTITGGIRNEEEITATAVDADATAISIGSNVVLPTISNTQLISATTQGLVEDTTTDDPVTGGDAVAIVIEAGGVNTILNQADGVISATARGDATNATAISSPGGTIGTITNSGFITATIAEDSTGTATAINLGGSATAATITNTGQITGHIVLGNGDDTLTQTLSSVEGRQTFITGSILTGAGADTVTIGSGTDLFGGITNGTGTLDVVVSGGTISLGQADRIEATTASFDAASAINIELDADAPAVARIATTGTTSIASGATVRLSLDQILTTDATFSIVEAGTLTAPAGLSGIVFDQLPFLYNVDFSVVGGTDIEADLSLKTAAELGLTGNQTAALNPLLNTLSQDATLGSIFASIPTEGEFFEAFTQFLPDTSSATRRAAIQMTDLSSSVIVNRLDAIRHTKRQNWFGRRATNGPWVQILGETGRQRKTATQAGYKINTVGVATGLDKEISRRVALGFGVTQAWTEYTENRTIDDPSTISSTVGSLYATWEKGSFFVNMLGHGGLNRYESERNVVLGTELRNNRGDWDGMQFGGNVEMGAQLGALGLIVTPRAGISYLTLDEDGYTEDGGGIVDLRLSDRDTDSLRSTLGLDVDYLTRTGIGALVTGIHTKWSREFNTDPTTVTATFVDTGESFRNASDEIEENSINLGFLGEYRTTWSSFSVGYDATVEEKFLSHRATATLRLVF